MKTPQFFIFVSLGENCISFFKHFFRRNSIFHHHTQRNIFSFASKLIKHFVGLYKNQKIFKIYVKKIKRFKSKTMIKKNIRSQIDKITHYHTTLL